MIESAELELLFECPVSCPASSQGRRSSMAAVDELWLAFSSLVHSIGLLLIAVGPTGILEPFWLRQSQRVCPAREAPKTVLLMIALPLTQGLWQGWCQIGWRRASDGGEALHAHAECLVWDE